MGPQDASEAQRMEHRESGGASVSHLWSPQGENWGCLSAPNLAPTVPGWLYLFGLPAPMVLRSSQPINPGGGDGPRAPWLQAPGRLRWLLHGTLAPASRQPSFPPAVTHRSQRSHLCAVQNQAWQASSPGASLALVCISPGVTVV